MAIFDALYEFSDNQDIKGSGTTTQSTNIINWENTAREMGAGRPIYLNIQMSATTAGGTSIQFKLVGDSDNTITNGTTIYETPAIGYATLASGYWVMRMPLPVKCDAYQYLGIVYVNVGNVTTANVNAWLDYGSQSSYSTQVSTSNVT